MQRLPTVQCREAWQIVQIRAEIIALAACFPDNADIQDIANEAIPCRLSLEALLDIYFREVNEALCFLSTGGGLISCDRPIASCPSFHVITGASWGPNLHIYDAFATGFDFPELVTVNQSIIFNTSIEGATPAPMDFLSTVSFPLLENVSNSIICAFHPNLALFSAPLLTNVTGYFGVGSNAGLANIQVPLLANVGGTLGMGGNLWTHAGLDSLETVGDDIDISGAELLTVNLDSLVSFGGDFIAQDSSLTEDAVNYILVLLDGITPPLSGRTISLNLGFSAAPSGAGAAAKTNLQVLNTVLTN